MAAFAPFRHLIYEPVEDGRPSLEDRYRLRQRESPRSVAPPSLISNPLGNALAGYKARAKTSIRGGTFAPRATSGML
jgi:hypothetical protein